MNNFKNHLTTDLSKTSGVSPPDRIRALSYFKKQNSPESQKEIERQRSARIARTAGIVQTLVVLLVALFGVGCAEPSEPEPVTPPAQTEKLVCPSFATVTKVAGISATQTANAHNCDSLLGAAPNTLAVMSGQTMLGTIQAGPGVVAGNLCTFTFNLERSDVIQGTDCQIVVAGGQEVEVCNGTQSCESFTAYTVTVPAQTK